MKRIIVISKDSRIRGLVERCSGDREYLFLDEASGIFGHMYDSIPDLAIVEMEGNDTRTMTVINHIKADPIFGSMPVLAIIPDDPILPLLEDLFIEDFIRKEDMERDLETRIKLSILRSMRVVEINPLTRLPGNISINRTIQERLDRKETFALAYLDLDHFKPFNDKYGFGRGDEVIKATGRLILNIVKSRQTDGSFVGHIGGDDFVYIMEPDSIEEASKDIMEAFSGIINTFYDQEDRERGYIESKDRQGNVRSFPFMTLSIGIAHTRFMRYSHYGEINEVASRMKAYAKGFKGNCCKIDERRVNI